MTSVRAALHQDHERLDALFEELLNRVHVNDAIAANAAWTAFDQGLVAHFDAEEAEVLPLFERHDPAEAAAIRAEHTKLRAVLVELGVMLELHALREATVEELIRLLRAHAAREEEALYRWADSDLPAEPRASLLDRIREAERAALEKGRKLAGEAGTTIL